MVEYYDMIFKRRSFHLFRSVGVEKITPAELSEIEKSYRDFVPMYPEIRTAIRIVPAQTVNVKRDAAGCGEAAFLLKNIRKSDYRLY